MCSQLGGQFGKGSPASVLGATSKLFFNFNQPVVLCDPFPTAR